jgi:N-methylhydantoinase A
MDSHAPSLTAPWRIGVDVGGTFTDMVLRDAAGAVRIFKAPSVPNDPAKACWACCGWPPSSSTCR